MTQDSKHDSLTTVVQSCDGRFLLAVPDLIMMDRWRWVNKKWIPGAWTGQSTGLDSPILAGHYVLLLSVKADMSVTSTRWSRLDGWVHLGWWYIWADGIFGLMVYLGWWYIWADGIFGLMVYLGWWYIWADGIFGLMVYLGWWYIWADGIFGLMVYLHVLDMYIYCEHFEAGKNWTLQNGLFMW